MAYCANNMASSAHKIFYGCNSRDFFLFLPENISYSFFFFNGEPFMKTAKYSSQLSDYLMRLTDNFLCMTKLQNTYISGIYMIDFLQMYIKTDIHFDTPQFSLIST